MANVIPKVKMFLFVGIICLIINLSVVFVSYANGTTTDITTGKTDTEIRQEKEHEGDWWYQFWTYQIAGKVGNTVLASVTAFLPFFDLINIVTLHLDSFTALIYGLIVSIFGAIKLFILAVMVANFIPTENV